MARAAVGKLIGTGMQFCLKRCLLWPHYFQEIIIESVKIIKNMNNFNKENIINSLCMGKCSEIIVMGN